MSVVRVGPTIPVTRQFLEDWYVPVGEPDENGNQLWKSHAAIAFEEAATRMFERAASTIAEHLADPVVEPAASVTLEEMLDIVERSRALPPLPKRIDISDEALAALHGMLTEPVSSVVVRTAMLGGVPLVRDEGIPPGWAKVVPHDGEPLWIRVCS